MESTDLRIEGPQNRVLWATLSLPPQPKYPLVIMAHGFLGFKDWSFFPWQAEFFNQAGFPVLRFNFSGSGMGAAKDGPFTEPGVFQADTITKQVEDLVFITSEAVHGSLRPGFPPQPRVLLWGHSRGAGVCLLAAGKIPETAGVACWAGIARVNRYFFEAKQAWRKDGFFSIESNRTGQTLRSGTSFLDDVEAWGREGDVPTFLHNLGAPVLLLHGSEDTSVLPDESESLAAVKPTTQLAILAGADHKFNCVHPFLHPTGVLVEAAQKTVRFFEGALV
jgi:pimeloyl-ACP methyl ester carboxylesterase